MELTWGNKDLDAIGGDRIWLYSSKNTLRLHYDITNSLLGTYPVDMFAQACQSVLNDDITIR